MTQVNRGRNKGNVWAVVAAAAAEEEQAEKEGRKEGKGEIV